MTTGRNDGVLSALGLCRKAGKLKIGMEAAQEALRAGAPLAVVSCDAAERTRRNAAAACTKGARLVQLDCTMDELEAAVGRRFAVAAVSDTGLAQLVCNKLGEV